MISTTTAASAELKASNSDTEQDITYGPIKYLLRTHVSGEATGSPDGADRDDHSQSSKAVQKSPQCKRFQLPATANLELLGSEVYRKEGGE